MAQKPLYKLNFPAINSRLRTLGGVNQIWDSRRKIFLCLTPEEWVRQHAISFFAAELELSDYQIIQEFPVCLNSQKQRADIVIVDGECRPRILIECKSPEVKIDKKVLAQAVRYNSVIGAEFIVLTNGLSHHAFRRFDETGEYSPLSSFSDLRI